MDGGEPHPGLSALWKFCLQQDAQQRERDKHTFEQETELRACRYMVEFYKEEVKEIRRDKERLIGTLEDSAKRQKLDDEERNSYKATIRGKEQEIENLKSHLMNVVRERDAAIRDAHAMRGSLDHEQEARKGLRKSVRVLSNSLNGTTTEDIAVALEDLKKHCQ